MKKLTLLLAFIAIFAGNTAFAMSFDNDLYFGLQDNPNVVKLQEFLTTDGVYTGPITGNFFSLTLKAVKDFQTKYTISPAAGYFGPLTRVKANNLLGADITASNNQAIGELGNAPATTTLKSSTELMEEQINALLSQVSLLQQQLTAQRQANTAIQELQNKVVEQTQVIQSQQETLNQITQNTTPPVVSAPVVVVAPIEQPKVLYVIAKNYGGNPNWFVSGSLKAKIGEQVIFNVFVKKGDEIVGYSKNKGLFDIQVSTPDIEQGGTIGMNNSSGQGIYLDREKITSSQYAPFLYYPKTAGTHTITFFSPSLNSTTSIDVVVE